jgi:predicted metal-binding protein
MHILPSDNSYRTFSDLIAGYRMFRVIAEAVASGIIDLLDSQERTADELLAATALNPAEGRRFVELLVNVGVLAQYDGSLYLSRFSRTFLSRTSPVSQRQVLAFEPLLMENWQQLGTVLRAGQGTLIREQAAEQYRERLNLFQGAMAEAAQLRSQELWDALPALPDQGLIIDIGAGSGAYLREFLVRHPRWQALGCDLPDVCAGSAQEAQPENLSFYPCNILDQRELAAFVEQYRGRADVLLFSNLCHCYSGEENSALLDGTAPLLTACGVVMVHDFFRNANSTGALYDLHMLVNTYNGRSYATTETAEMLQHAGFPHQTTIELPSCSLAIIAGRSPHLFGSAASGLFTLKQRALAGGFFAAVELDPATIRSEAWVRAKCAYGCSQYGKRWSCPPHVMDQAGFQELLGCYSRALLVAGQPPLASFQEQLLELEKTAFLSGFTKALVLSGGPCSWCDHCAEQQCRFPEKRRPSLEACGCDVFALAGQCGLSLTPLRNSDDFVQYIGLLLVE